MAERTAIEWTNATWTPIRAKRIELQSDGSGKERIGWHCEHVSEGCRNCYSERINQRLGTGREFTPAHLKHRTSLGDSRGDVYLFLDERMLCAPQHWRRPRMIFVCSMTDLFADFVRDEWPAGQLDHVNGNKADNRLANLREVTCAQNAQNLRHAPRSNKSTGLLGVSRVWRSATFAARITVGSKTRSLGNFRSPQEAHAAYVDAKRRFHSHGEI